MQELLQQILGIRSMLTSWNFPMTTIFLPTFNVKDLRPYQGEDLRASFFSQLWGIDAGASTTNNGNSIFIMKNSNSGGFTLETPNIFLFSSNLSIVTILI